jgi:branched-chain amino acid transport system permease protein
LARRARPPAGETLLEVRGATMRFGGLVAVNEMNLTVAAGEIVALIGPNGAGKTTTFNVISGVLDPSDGEIRFRGQSLRGRSARKIAALGMSRTFQHVKLLPTMSVVDNVAIGAHGRENPGLLRGVVTGAWRLERRDEMRLLAEAARQIERVGLADHMF